MTIQSTFLLNPVTSDWMLDAGGNPAIATGPYAIAQDAASAVKLFLGEYWFDTTIGTAYYSTTLGKFPSIELLKAQAEAAAETTTGVASAVCYITSIQNRAVTGQIQITTTSGATVAMGFSA